MPTAATPTNLSVSQGNSTVYLTWDLMSGATSYLVQRGTDGITFGTVGTASTPYYLDGSVSTGIQYYYQIASVNGSGTSGSTAPPQVTIPSNNGQLALGTVRLLAQQRADRVNSSFVTNAEWNSYINQSYFELYDRLVTLFEDYYVAQPAAFTVTGLTNTYPLPDGTTSFTNASGAAFVAPAFYKLLGVDCGLNISGNAWITVKKYNFVARNRFVYPNLSSTFMGVFNLQYRVLGSNIQFIPTPAGSQIMRFWYVPRLTQLVSDTDIMDGISGWTEYVIVDAAIKALQKEESDVSALMAQKEGLVKRVEESAANRDAGEPDTISNTRTWTERWGGGGGGGYDGGWGGS